MDAKTARHLKGLEVALGKAREAVRHHDRGAVSFELGQAEAQAAMLRDELGGGRLDMVAYAARVCGVAR